MGLFRKKRIANLLPLPLEELRKRTRILVIDDDESSFPFELLKKEGYSIDYWPKVENLSKLEEGFFDIIILDIQGVAQNYSREDGLGILEHIKQRNPSQVVVAFSGQSFDLSKNRFWKMADDSLSKPVDVTKCKRLIDDIIVNKITLSHYWSLVTDILTKEGVSAKQIASIEDKVTRALERKDREAVSEIMKSALDKADVGVRIAAIVIKISALFGS